MATAAVTITVKLATRGRACADELMIGPMVVWQTTKATLSYAFSSRDSAKHCRQVEVRVS